jgi:signal recognition particle GTPase
MNECRCTDVEMPWPILEEINARALVSSAVGAARAQVDYSRAQNAARRSEALLGKNAGREHEYRAESYFHSRREQLQEVKQSYTQFIARLDKSQRKQISDFLRGGGLKELTADAKRMVTIGLLEADLSPEDARQTIKSLDGRLNTIAKLSSFEKLDAYMHQHIDELISKRFGNPSATQGLCVLILVITSVFAVLVLIAALICALTLGLGCRGLLQRLIDQACPP